MRVKIDPDMLGLCQVQRDLLPAGKGSLPVSAEQADLPFIPAGQPKAGAGLDHPDHGAPARRLARNPME